MSNNSKRPKNWNVYIFIKQYFDKKNYFIQINKYYFYLNYPTFYKNICHYCVLQKQWIYFISCRVADSSSRTTSNCSWEVIPSRQKSKTSWTSAGITLFDWARIGVHYGSIQSRRNWSGHSRYSDLISFLYILLCSACLHWMLFRFKKFFKCNRY